MSYNLIYNAILKNFQLLYIRLLSIFVYIFIILQPIHDINTIVFQNINTNSLQILKKHCKYLKSKKEERQREP